LQTKGDDQVIEKREGKANINANHKELDADHHHHHAAVMDLSTQSHCVASQCVTEV
jgi:hypothetical protein